MRGVRKVAWGWACTTLILRLYYACRHTIFLSDFVDTNNPETLAAIALLGIVAPICYVATTDGDGGDWTVWGSGNDAGGDSGGDGGGD